MAKSKGKKHLVQDTDVTFANANKDILITGDLDTFDLQGWGNGMGIQGAEAFLIGGSLDGNSPFNTYAVKDLKGLAENWHQSGQGLQEGNEDSPGEI